MMFSINPDSSELERRNCSCISPCIAKGSVLLPRIARRSSAASILASSVRPALSAFIRACSSCAKFAISTYC